MKILLLIEFTGGSFISATVQAYAMHYCQERAKIENKYFLIRCARTQSVQSARFAGPLS